MDYSSKHMMPVSSLIISHQIRYDKLADLTNEAFVGSTAMRVNIYIDLYQICLKLFRSNIELIGRYSLAAHIMNLCAHYRGFYKKYYGITTKIFLIYTNDAMKYNLSNLSNYNEKNNHLFKYNIGVSKYIGENTDILNIITRYFKDIYFIQSPFEPMAMIAENINSEFENGNTNPNIIISTSKLLFQIPALVNTKTVIFFHKYTFNGDINARIISKENALLQYLILNKISRGQNIAERISSEFLSIIYTMNGFDSRNLSCLVRLPTCLKILDNAISHGLLFNSYTSDIDNIYELFKKYLKNISKEEIIQRFRAVDLIYNENVYKYSSYCKNKEWKVNLYSPEEIRRLNTTYFKNYPIDLERL